MKQWDTWEFVLALHDTDTTCRECKIEGCSTQPTGEPASGTFWTVLMINSSAVRDQLCAGTTIQIRNYFRPLVANFIINYTLKFHSAVSGALCLDNRSLWSHGELLRGTARAIKVFVGIPVNFNAHF